MQIICVREGRFGIHIGDIIEVPDGTDTLDNYFDFVDPGVVAAAKEKADAEKAEAEKTAKADAKAEADKLAADLAEAETLKADLAAKNESGTV